MEKISSNKSFGVLFCIVFVLIAVWPVMHEGSLRIWPIPISFIFLVLGLLNSKLLSPLNLVWVKFGELLGKIIAPIVMIIIYIFRHLIIHILHHVQINPTLLSIGPPMDILIRIN